MFLVLAHSGAEKLGPVITQKFPNSNYSLGNSNWIIVSDNTAKGLCDLLGITDGSVATGMIVLFTSYYGRASTQIWEWIASKMGTKNA